MKISIHQPTYWPWLGLLDKIAKSDEFIVLDRAQISKGSYQYRNIFFCNGKAKFLTLPINFHLGDSFDQLEFTDGSWNTKHKELIRNYYVKSPFFQEVFPIMETFYDSDFVNPLDAIVKSMQLSMDLFGINTKMKFSSSYGVSSSKGQMVLDLCKGAEASTYLAGTGSKGYMQDVLQNFAEASIQVDWQEFIHPVYNQDSEHKFVEGLAGIDVLFWLGIDRARQMFWENIALNG